MPLSQAKVGSLRNRLIKGATGTFGLNVAGTGLSFIASVLLARLLGAKDFGAYAYAITWVGFLSFITVLGLDKLLIRNVATYQTTSSWGLMLGLLRLANRLVFWVSLGLSLLAAIVALILIERSDLEVLSTFWIALISLPLMGLTRIRQATMRGLHYVVMGQLPEILLRPMLFILLLGVVSWWMPKEIGAPLAMGMQAIAVGIAFLIGNCLLQNNLPSELQEVSPIYETEKWMRSAFALLFIGSMYLINSRIDTLMLGAIEGSEAVGIYTVAYRGSQLIAFVLVAVNSVLAPTVASIYAESDMKRLQRLVTKSSRLTLLASLPIGIGLIVFGDWFLSIFGPEFIQGRLALSILSGSYLVNCAMGASGVLLVMTGEESKLAIIAGLNALLNTVLNAIMIPYWSLSGAAVATAISQIVWSISLTVLAYMTLKIKATP